MKNIKSLKALFLSLLVAVVTAFCGFSLTACNNDSGENNGENGGEVTAPEKPLSLTTSVKTTDDGENTYTINAIVNPSTLTPRWAIVWENPDSEWATGKDTAYYLNLELSNGDKTATLSIKQPFGETALLTATISSPTGEVSVSKKVDYEARFLYEVNSSGNYTAVGLESDIFSVVNIPRSYNGTLVNRLGYDLFKNCTTLISLVIPDTITDIGGVAFFRCTSLVSVVVPSSVATVDCFTGCTSLKNVVLSEGVTTIGPGAFCNCTSLVSIVLPSSVSTLGVEAFEGCTSLESITLSERLSSISVRCFNGCTSLKSIVIPASVTSIGGYAFAGCTSLKTVTYLGNKTQITISDTAFADSPYPYQ